MKQSAGAGAAEDESGPPGAMGSRVASRVAAAASDLALVVKPDGTIQEVTVGEAVVAHPWAALVGKRWDETITADSRSKVESLLSEARAGAVTRAREINMEAGGGSEVPFRFSAVLLGDEQRVVVLGRDLRQVAALQ
jgi:hypothetical protein